MIINILFKNLIYTEERIRKVFGKRGSFTANPPAGRQGNEDARVGE